MTDKQIANQLFTPGASTSVAPVGDVERQAIASLGGYTYQVAVSALAWLELPEEGRLYLEVAEDYAVVAEQALNAVQVKDTEGSGAVTLNTESVREAVGAFVDLVARNPGRSVELHFFTTSPPGTERKLEDRPAGQAGLTYWRRAAAGADVAPLRSILTGATFTPAVRDFVNARDDDALRRDMLRNVHWECGRPSLPAVSLELQERLVVLGRERFQIPAEEAKRLAAILMYDVLKKSILKTSEERSLSRAELYATIDTATRLSMPRNAIDSMAQLATALSAGLTGGGGAGGAFSADQVGWLVSRDDLPIARATIARPGVEAAVIEATKRRGAAVLVGGSGLGKSLIARAVAGRLAASFFLADFRDLDAAETRRRLDFLFGS